MHVGELRVDSGGRANSRSQLGLATALLSFALASDDEGIEFTRADGNTEELTRAQLRTAAGITGGSGCNQISVTSAFTLDRVSDSVTLMPDNYYTGITLAHPPNLRFRLADVPQPIHAQSHDWARARTISTLTGRWRQPLMKGGLVTMDSNVLDFIARSVFLARDDSYNVYVGINSTNDPMRTARFQNRIGPGTYGDKRRPCRMGSECQ